MFQHLTAGDGSLRIFNGFNGEKAFAFHVVDQRQSRALGNILAHISLHSYNTLGPWSLQGQHLQRTANNMTVPE